MYDLSNSILNMHLKQKEIVPLANGTVSLPTTEEKSMQETPHSNLWLSYIQKCFKIKVNNRTTVFW